MSSANCTGIEPNPDISGVGVRTAIYAQAVLTLIQPILASLDGYISEEELVGLHELYIGILLPGCALLISAIIQNQTFGLSVYHATIVLNLSWINNTSALIFFQFALIAQMKLDRQRELRRKVGVMWELLYKSIEKAVKAREKRTPHLRAILEVALRIQAEGMKAALRIGAKNDALKGSKELMEDVIQNLSALLGVGDSSKFSEAQNLELEEILDATNKRLQDPRLRKSLGLPDHVANKKDKRKVRKVLEALVSKIPGNEIVLSLLDRDWTMSNLASAHLLLFSVFGVWLWFTIHRFGNCEPVTKLTKLSFLFHAFPVTSQILRVAFIIIYIIGLLPIINIMFFGGLELGFAIGLRRLINRIREPKSSFPEDGLLPLFIFLTFVLQAYFIINTELTIKYNKRILSQTSDSKESDWTFGQTLAIALVVLPLLQVWSEARKESNVEIFKQFFVRLGRFVE